MTIWERLIKKRWSYWTFTLCRGLLWQIIGKKLNSTRLRNDNRSPQSSRLIQTKANNRGILDHFNHAPDIMTLNAKLATRKHPPPPTRLLPRRQFPEINWPRLRVIKLDAHRFSIFHRAENWNFLFFHRWGFFFKKKSTWHENEIENGNGSLVDKVTHPLPFPSVENKFCIIAAVKELFMRWKGNSEWFFQSRYCISLSNWKIYTVPC